MLIRAKLLLLLATWVGLTSGTRAAEPLPSAYPRSFVVEQELVRWDFVDGTGGWTAQNQCQLNVADGYLGIQSSGGDPYLNVNVQADGSDFAVRIRMRLRTGGSGQFFWSSSRQRGASERRRVAFELTHDGAWHEYTVHIQTDGDLTALRFDPGTSAGNIEVDWIALHRGRIHPLDITGFESHDASAVVSVWNADDQPVTASCNGRSLELPGQRVTRVSLDVPPAAALFSVPVHLESPGLPSIDRTFWVYRGESALDAVTQERNGVTFKVAKDGSVVQLIRAGKQIAALAPLVHCRGKIPPLHISSPSDWPLTFSGEGIEVTLGDANDGPLSVQIRADMRVEGPVVRVFGAMEQGLLAGVEYLGRGEQSSSRLDIETDEHLRFAPDSMHLTMPLMAVVTAQSSVALSWDDMLLQPTFAARDFLDYGSGHRMSLQGRQIDAVIRVGDGWDTGGRLEDAILWAVLRRGLPALPPRPRTDEAQSQLSLAAYHGAILDPQNGGWFHAVVPGVRATGQRGAPFADFVSAIFRLTGQLPDMPSLQMGGAHVRNSASYFLRGQVDQWTRIVNAEAEQLRRAQAEDGSYRYDGEFRRGHFENTASGVCARPAQVLLEHAGYTGSRESLAAGLKTLDFMRRFRTPRGAQTWEVPLHTPDILASANLVRAYVNAFELTGDPEHLRQARRWAISGLPFVYQWSNQPIMLYATTPVLGATHWQAPNWIGLPVQWCGTVYAYALLELAPHDATLNWRHIAEGILICAEQMQYPEGVSAGCLPDAFELSHQQRRPADINPSVLVGLRLRCRGQLDGLAVASNAEHRVVAPFPVEIVQQQARIQGSPGVPYQVLIDGQRIVDIQSRGEDTVELSSKPPHTPP